MKFDVDDKNRCRLVCVKFYLHRCRFAVAVAKCLGGSLFGDTRYIGTVNSPHASRYQTAAAAAAAAADCVASQSHSVFVRV